MLLTLNLQSKQVELAVHMYATLNKQRHKVGGDSVRSSIKLRQYLDNKHNENLIAHLKIKPVHIF